MLWRVAIHGGHLHPDFIRDRLTDKQLHEVAWYFQRHPFGHDIDHIMMAKIVCSMGGGKIIDHIPKTDQPGSESDFISNMSGLSEYLKEQGIEEEYDGDD